MCHKTPTNFEQALHNLSDICMTNSEQDYYSTQNDPETHKLVRDYLYQHGLSDDLY